MLPSDIKGDAVTGNLSDGILTVMVPKSDAAKPRRVEITS
jgi:HSP20 family protein